MNAINTNATFTARVNGIAKDLKRLEIEVPEALAKELALQQDLRNDELRSSGRLAQLKNALATASDAKEFIKARDELGQALAVEGRVNEAVADATAQRSYAALFDTAEQIQASLSDKFNQIVKGYDLNTLVSELPDLSDRYLTPLMIAPNQQAALNAWQNGVNELHPVWNVYLRVADFLGYDLGDAIEPSANLALVFALGEPNDFSDAQRAADTIPAVLQGTDQARRYGNLAPFVFLPLNGVPLGLKPLVEADALRQTIQFGG